VTWWGLFCAAALLARRRAREAGCTCNADPQRLTGGRIRLLHYPKCKHPIEVIVAGPEWREP